MADILEIRYLGAQGDGVAETKSGPVFVPFSLPGEHVETSGGGKRRTLSRVVHASTDRIEPACRHFGTCGGCQLQHFEHGAYLRWKQGILETALQREGIEFGVEPILSFEEGRRRAVFTARQTSSGLVLGYQEKQSHALVAIEQCPILTDEIAASLGEICGVINPLVSGRNPSRVTVLACDNGLDIDVSGSNAPSQDTLQRIIRQFAQSGFSRLSFDGEVLAEVRRPVLKIGLAEVTPPPGGFVQAVRAAEEAMAALVTAHLANRKSVADLYCGMGTFALRLAQQSQVLAIESEQSALDSLTAAWRATGGGLKQIRTEKRDLSRRPLMTAEMAKLDGIVFDPPRAGAEIQVKQIARSKVARIAAVSCNPTSLARDLKVLLAGGYDLVSITPLDQFRYTPHLEAVALLVRR